MKKTILVVLSVVMVVTPCFAEEVEPDGLFSIEETAWWLLPIAIVVLWPIPIPIPLLVPIYQIYANWGFYDGEVYPYSTSEGVKQSFYVDLGLVSIFMYEKEEGNEEDTLQSHYTEVGFGIMQPIGIGLITIHLKFSNGFPSNVSAMGLIIKTDNSWKPIGVQ